jgi:hypothetical protein
MRYTIGNIDIDNARHGATASSVNSFVPPKQRPGGPAVPDALISTTTVITYQVGPAEVHQEIYRKTDAGRAEVERLWHFLASEVYTYHKNTQYYSESPAQRQPERGKVTPETSCGIDADGALRKLQQAGSANEIAAVLRNLAKIADQDVCGRLYRMLQDNAVSPLNRWAVLEFLTTRKYPGLLSVVLDHVASQRLDDFLDGCTIALRVLAVPEQQTHRVAELMRMQAEATWPWRKDTVPLCARVFRDTLLILGSYGEEGDARLLLTCLEADIRAEFTTHIMESFRRLMVRRPDRIAQADLAELREKARRLLDVWAAPLAVNVEPGMLHRSVCIMRTLASRLASEDIEVAWEAVRRSAHPCLVRGLLESIAEAERDLDLVGMAEWASRQAATVAHYRAGLAELCSQSP